VGRNGNTFPLVKDYAHLLEQHFEALTGRTGEVARRWRSLTIFLDPLPYSTITRVSLLESLDIHTPRRPSMPVFPTEDHLLDSIVWPLSFPARLSFLRSSKYRLQDDLSHTTLFNSIQTLYLGFRRSRAVPPSESDSEPLAYPRLTELPSLERYPRLSSIDCTRLTSIHCVSSINPVCLLCSIPRSRVPTFAPFSCVPMCTTLWQYVERLWHASTRSKISSCYTIVSW
jgi:hypothetical protein